MIKKIKVCIVSYLGYSLYQKEYNPRIGGSEIQLYLLSNELSKNPQFDVHVITGYEKGGLKGHFTGKPSLHYVIPSLNKKSIKSPLTLLYSLIKINPDIVIQRAFGIPTGICGLYCRLFGKKFIYSIATQIDLIKEIAKGILGLFFKVGFSLATFIVAQTKSQILDLEQLKEKKFSNICVIKNGYTITKVNPANKKYILWVGRAVKLKRPEIFLELARQYQNEEFIIILNKSINKKYWETIYQQVAEIKNLEFIEFVNFFKIDSYFKNAKIFINTSLYEGFPNTFIQALKYNTPIVSLNIDPDNFLEENKIGFNCFNDFEKLVSNLKRLLEEENLYKRYSSNAYSYVKKQHDIKITASKWARLIQLLTSH